MYKNEALSRLHEYAEEMKASELSQRTITKYLADIRQWLDSQSETILPGDMRGYKDGLADKYSASSINSKLISVNRYLKWLGQNELLVKTRRIQKSSSLEHILTKNDYNKMLSYAKETGRIKLFHIMRTIALTGIRIGELKAITVEAVTAGSAEVYNKGKYRCIYLSNTLCQELLDYCQSNQISEGPVFSGRTPGKCISPESVWQSMKLLAANLEIPLKRVYPHSLRHLFAKTYMEEIGDLTELADILGHSRLETTRIYTKTTASEKRNRLDRLPL